jgi:xylulokinase
MWTAMGATVAAEMLEWYRKQFGGEAHERAAAEGGTDWDYLIQTAAASPPGARGIMFLPHMSGSHCPVVDHRSLGAWLGLRNTATPGDMLRAIIEGLDYQFLEVVSAFETAVGTETERVVAIGGPVKNSFWMQNKADVLGKPIEVPELDEAVPLGAAILAGIGVGLYRDEEDAFRQVCRPGRVYQPNAELTSKYAQWFETYRQIYPALRDINSQLYSTG